MRANTEKSLWEYGAKVVLKGGWGPSFGEMPSCDFKRDEKCALTSDLCNWPRCPYTPKYNITAKLKCEDGKIVRRVLHTDGTIGTSYIGDAARALRLIVIEFSKFQPNATVEFFSKCIDCGCPITEDEWGNSQGGHCKQCWDYTLHGPGGPTPKTKTRGPG